MLLAEQDWKQSTCSKHKFHLNSLGTCPILWPTTPIKSSSQKKPLTQVIHTNETDMIKSNTTNVAHDSVTSLLTDALPLVVEGNACTVVNGSSVDAAANNNSICPPNNDKKLSTNALLNILSEVEKLLEDDDLFWFHLQRKSLAPSRTVLLYSSPCRRECIARI